MERKKKENKGEYKIFFFFGENFCDSSFPNRQKIESFALIAFFSHLLCQRPGQTKFSSPDFN